MTDKTGISLKNTKEQILAAYHDAIEAAKKKNQETPAQEQVKREQQKQIEEIKQSTHEQIIAQLNQLKTGCLNSVDEFIQTITKEHERFTKLEEAISLEQHHLEALYAIKEEANTLSAIMLAHQKEKEDFKASMTDEQLSWQQKLDQLEAQYKGRKAELEKQREREEEEYSYNLNQARKMDKDKYDQHKQSLLQELELKKQELELREKNMLAKEQEFSALQTRIANLDQEIATRIAEAEAHTSKTLHTEFKYQQSLAEEQNKRNVELLQQKIELLEQKYQEQSKLVDNLSSKLQMAQEQTQSIAHKALETAAQRAIFVSPNDSSNKN